MKKIIYFLFFILIADACGTARKADKDDNTAANNYKRDVTSIHPQFSIFHVSDSISELHFKINNKELLYTRPDGINFSSNVLISYRLLSTFDSKEIMDSSSVKLIDVNNNDAEKFLIGKLNVRAISPHSYFLKITIVDLNRNISSSTTIDLEKNNDLNRQNFLVKSKNTNVPLFRNYVTTDEEVVINYKAKIAVNLYVRYYKRDFPLAAPPFSDGFSRPFQYKSDSAFVMQLSSDGSVNFKATKKGFYHFLLDTTKRDGLTLFNFSSETFPDVKKATDLVPPLRFITSREEFDELTYSKNKKSSVEKFWMNCTSNQEKARDIIRKYYNRVQDANAFFTSYLEGWKTDRGMIYLIYGSPNVMYKTGNSETWTYGEENNFNSLSFSFSKVNNPFTENDYTLDRSSVYKQSWYAAVDIWRQGRTYLQD